MAKETRKKNKQDREDLNREAELLRFQNKMMVQSIKELLEEVDKPECDMSDLTVAAIREAVLRVDCKLDLAKILGSEIDHPTAAPSAGSEGVPRSGVK